MEERNCEIFIKQTLLSVQIKLKTAESASLSIHSVIDDAGGFPQLLYYYRNEPDANLRDASPIHYGHASFDISNVQKLTGSYFTDRNTRGTIKVSAVK